MCAIVFRYFKWSKKAVGKKKNLRKKSAQKMTKEDHVNETETASMMKKELNKEAIVEIPKEALVSPAKQEVFETSVSFCINVAKKEGKGEDSDPFAHVSNNGAVVGVFDGMGGAGAAEYPTANGTHTGAYLASRMVKNACQEYIRSKENAEIDILELTARIKKSLDECMETNGIRPSGLRSAIIRILPTTLAMVRAEKEKDKTHVMSYWCGDSRNYILTKSGLIQVSVDHLSKPQDPLENLRNDESLANCVCQDKPFSIESYDCGFYTDPIIILSATDGCFGYLRSPMHFEHLLLKTLVESNTISEWKSNIEKMLKPVSGDDFSIGLVMVDMNFEYWKKTMDARLKSLESKIILPIQQMEDDIENAKRQVENAKSALYDGITAFWEIYKHEFMLVRKEDSK